MHLSFVHFGCNIVKVMRDTLYLSQDNFGLSFKDTTAGHKEL